MKKITLLASLLLILAINAWGQVAPSTYGDINLRWLTSQHKDDLKEGCYECTTTYYNFEVKFGKNIVGKSVKKESSFYDDHGFLLAGGKSTYKNIYDNEGRISEINEYVNDKLKYKRVYKYVINKGKKVVVVTTYKASGEENSALVWMKIDNSIATTSTGSLGQSVIEYNSKGKAKYEEVRLMIGDVTTNYEYNAQGSLIKSVTSGGIQDKRNRPSANRMRQQMPDIKNVYDGYEYDADGNWIKRFHYKNGEPQYYECREISKSKDGYEKWLKAKQEEEKKKAILNAQQAEMKRIKKLEDMKYVPNDSLTTLASLTLDAQDIFSEAYKVFKENQQITTLGHYSKEIKTEILVKDNATCAINSTTNISRTGFPRTGFSSIDIPLNITVISPAKKTFKAIEKEVALTSRCTLKTNIDFSEAKPLDVKLKLKKDMEKGEWYIENTEDLAHIQILKNNAILYTTEEIKTSLLQAISENDAIQRSAKKKLKVPVTAYRTGYGKCTGDSIINIINKEVQLPLLFVLDTNKIK